MVAFVKTAEQALFPYAAPRNTATFWLTLMEQTYQAVTDGGVIDKELERQLHYCSRRVADGLIVLIEHCDRLAHSQLGLADAYQLEEAILGEEERPFAIAYAKLELLLFEYSQQEELSVEAMKSGIRPRRPKPAAHPAMMLKTARMEVAIRGKHTAPRAIAQINRVICDVALHMIELR
jgi:hypothetical protein